MRVCVKLGLYVLTVVYNNMTRINVTRARFNVYVIALIVDQNCYTVIKVTWLKKLTINLILIIN